MSKLFLAAIGMICAVVIGMVAIDTSITPTGAATSPGGSNTQVQYNDSGLFGGDTGLTFNETTNVLTATGGLITSGDVSGVNASMSGQVSGASLVVSGATATVGGNDIVREGYNHKDEITIASAHPTSPSSAQAQRMADYVVTGTGSASDFYTKVTAAVAEAVASSGTYPLAISFAEGLYVNPGTPVVDLSNASHLTISGPSSVTFTVANNAGTNAGIFTASNASDIHIIGGMHFDGNALGQGSGTPTASMICSAIQFTDVTGSIVGHFTNWSGKNITLNGNCQVDITQTQWIGSDYDLNDVSNPYDPPHFMEAPRKVLSTGNTFKDEDGTTVWSVDGGANSALTISNDYAASGTSSFKLTSGSAAGSYGHAKFIPGGTTTYDLTKWFLRFKIYIVDSTVPPDTGNAVYVNVRLYSASSGAHYAYWAGQVNNLTWDRWLTATVNIAQCSAVTTWQESWFTNIDEIRIVYGIANQTYASCYLDDIELVRKLNTDGIVTFRFDDNARSHYTLAAPELARYGWSGVEFLNPETIAYNSSYLTLNECKTLQDYYGWDISNHTWGHTLQTSLNIGEWVDEVEDTTEWLLDNGFAKGARWFGTPFHKNTYPAFTNKLEDLFQYNDQPPFATVMSGTPIFPSTLSQRFDMRALPYDHTTFASDVFIGDNTEVTTAEFRAACHYAHKYGLHFTMLFHTVTAGLVESYAQIAYEEGLDCMTYSQLYDFLMGKSAIDTKSTFTETGSGTINNGSATATITYITLVGTPTCVIAFPTNSASPCYVSTSGSRSFTLTRPVSSGTRTFTWRSER